jgi:hypothetical protein
MLEMKSVKPERRGEREKVVQELFVVFITVVKERK